MEPDSGGTIQIQSAGHPFLWRNTNDFSNGKRCTLIDEERVAESFGLIPSIFSAPNGRLPLTKLIVAAPVCRCHKNRHEAYGFDLVFVKGDDLDWFGHSKIAHLNKVKDKW